MVALSSALATKFPSLPATTKQFLGLYFAASWCPDCTPTTPLVATIASQDNIDVVYVASDNTADQVASYVPSNLLVIPFEKEQERSALKIHFGACAAKEVASLGLEEGGGRKYGLPALLVIESETGKVLQRNGVDDLGNDEKDVLAKWSELLASQD